MYHSRFSIFHVSQSLILPGDSCSFPSSRRVVVVSSIKPILLILVFQLMEGLNSWNFSMIAVVVWLGSVDIMSVLDLQFACCVLSCLQLLVWLLVVWFQQECTGCLCLSIEYSLWYSDSFRWEQCRLSLHVLTFSKWGRHILQCWHEELETSCGHLCFVLLKILC